MSTPSSTPTGTAYDESGRRATARRRGPDVTVLLAVLLPLVTVALLVTGGSRTPPAPAQAPRTTDLTSATVACPSGIAGTGQVLVASAGPGSGQVLIGRDRAPLAVAPGLPATVQAGEPQVVRGEGGLAPGLLAGRSGTRPLAAVDCAPPTAEQWFTGLGAGARHASVLELVNPSAGPAVADVVLVGPDGPVEAPRLRGLLVPGGETRRLDLSAEVPFRGELAARVTTSRGRLSVAVEDTVDQLGQGSRSTDWLGGQVAPTTSNLLLGLPTGTGERTLVLANPGTDEVRADLFVVTAESAFAPQGVEEVRVPPQSVARVSLASVLGGPSADGALGVEVRSTGPLTATLRTDVDGDLAHLVAGASVREPTALAVPAGAKRLVLAGADGVGVVTVRTRSAAGEVLAEERREISPGRSVEVALPDPGALVEVTPERTGVSGAVLVEGAGAAVLRLRELSRSTLVPGVRPALSAPLD